MSDWAYGTVGGALIGLGAALLLWSVGRIAGISGIASGALEGARGDRAWRIAFLAGMMIAGAVALQFVPILNTPYPPEASEAVTVNGLSVLL